MNYCLLEWRTDVNMVDMAASTVIYFDPCSFRGLGTQVCQHCGRCIPQIGTFMPICPLCHSKGLGPLGMGGLAHKPTKASRKPPKKNNIPEVLGMGGSHQEFPNIVFFLVFSMSFVISLHGALPKETQNIFFCYHYMEVYTDFLCLWYKVVDRQLEEQTS